jgi:hypothetical protein
MISVAFWVVTSCSSETVRRFGGWKSRSVIEINGITTQKTAFFTSTLHKITGKFDCVGWFIVDCNTYTFIFVLLVGRAGMAQSV